jgi:hypothetical protein
MRLRCEGEHLCIRACIEFLPDGSTLGEDNLCGNIEISGNLSETPTLGKTF